MARYLITYVVSSVEEEVFNADSFDEAQRQWEEYGVGDELYSIKNLDTGEEVEF